MELHIPVECYNNLFASMFLRVLKIQNLSFDNLFPIESLDTLHVFYPRSERNINLTEFFPFLKTLKIPNQKTNFSSDHVLDVVEVKFFSDRIKNVKSRTIAMENNFHGSNSTVFDLTNYEVINFKHFEETVDKNNVYKFKEKAVVQILNLFVENSDIYKLLRSDDFPRLYAPLIPEKYEHRKSPDDLIFEKYFSSNSSKLEKYGYRKSFDGSIFERNLFGNSSVIVKIGKENFEKIEYRGMEIFADMNYVARLGNKFFISTVVNEIITDEFYCGKDGYFEFINCLITKTSGFGRCKFVNCTFNVPLDENFVNGAIFSALSCDFRRGINNFHVGVGYSILKDSLIREEFVMTKESSNNELNLKRNIHEKNCRLEISALFGDVLEWF